MARQTPMAQHPLSTPWVVALVIVGATLRHTAMAAGADRGREPAAKLFPLARVRLTDGPLQRQQALNAHYLRKLEPDRLLSLFRQSAGLEPAAPPYRGWESEPPNLAGHILGFYMSGAAMTVQATGDAVLRDRLNYIVDQLAAVQAANGSGFLLASPNGKRVFAQIAAGRIDVTGPPYTGAFINGTFEPTYTLNKLMLGLYQVYAATGNEKAKDVLIRAADWFGHDVLDKLSDAQCQTLLDCEHGSLNESFADAYQLSGDARHLKWARRLCHERMLAPLAAGDGAFLTHWHANTQIPKFTGFESVYAATGEARLDDAAMNFWNEVVDHRSWVIGGNSADEHFFPTGDFAKALHAAAGPESCNSVNMLRLTEALYPRHPDLKLIDFYERALFNHILSAHDPERGMFVYYTTMRPDSYRVYSDEFDSMWCCVGTGMEVPGSYGRMIYTRDADDGGLRVNLFAASELDWPEKGVRLTQKTRFPDEAGTTLQMKVASPRGRRFALRIRHPWWVPAGGLGVFVNGRSVPLATKPGEYATIDRAWMDGDTVRVALPMHITVAPLPGDPGYVAFEYGPIVLSGTLGREGLAKSDFWQIRTTVPTRMVPESHAPCLVIDDPATIAQHVERLPGDALAFRTHGVGRPDDVKLIPFFRNHFERYAIYWRTRSAADWQAEQTRLTDAAQAAAALDARTIDRVLIGDDASEKTHHLVATLSDTGSSTYSVNPGDVAGDEHWRAARPGGSFGYTLATHGVAAATLRCTYWARDGGARTFDVLAGDRVLETRALVDRGSDGFFAVDLPLPADVLRGKSAVTATFVPHPRNSAGGLFGLRLLAP